MDTREVKTLEEIDCTKPPQVEVGRASEISNILWVGKLAVQNYAKVSNTIEWKKKEGNFSVRRESLLPFYQIICHVDRTIAKEVTPEFIEIWLSEVNADRYT